MTGSRIHVLRPDVIAKIRAGEVIDRPAAVAKELIENAIDAGSRLIAVHVASSPERSIRVQDDGHGMDREDALLSIRRHATSKLDRAEDLASIRSLGFRGEALAAIAEVSRFTLSTRAADELAGTQVEVLGGAILQVSGVARAVGTTVAVEDLFFNTPARLQFLKSRDSESRAVARAVWSYALACPAIHWRIHVEGREETELPAGADLLERWRLLYGRGPGEGAVPFEFDAAGVRAHGVLGPPEQARATREHQTFVVNGRIVSTPALGVALRQGYGDLIPADRYPIALVLLDLDPSEVDVNVHPTKREVRFRDEASLFQATRRGVAAAMGRYVPVSMSPESGERARAPDRLGNSQQGTSTHPARPRPGLFDGVAVAEALYAPVQADPAAPTVRERDPAELRERLAEPDLPVWQLHERYLLAPIRGGLVIVDQHAAHERILYEEARASLFGTGGPSQHLLFPRVLELTRDEVETLLANEPHIRRLGYELSLLGEREVAVRGVPAPLAEEVAVDALRHLLGELETPGETGEAPEERLAKRYACHAAVRTGQALHFEERRALIDRLFATSLPHGDPHGRPTFVRVSMEELDRRFGRR